MSPVTLSRVSGGQGVASLASFKRNLGLSVGGPLSVEDVFSTYLYTGNGSTQTITNGIDLAGEGGLVWIKRRDIAERHALIDSERGLDYVLATNEFTAQRTRLGWVQSLNNDGFTLNTVDTEVNFGGSTYASWTFRKAPGFFDVVTYTGNDTARTISHSLGSTPGCIIVKGASFQSNWYVWHRDLNISSNHFLNLNTANPTQSPGDDIWNGTAPTSTHFSIGTTGNVNLNGETYVAYLFAHDEAIFGENEDQSIIKCDSYTGSTGPVTVNLGWEPQWVLVRRSTGTVSNYSNWAIFDNMRGVFTGGNDVLLAPNLSTEEGGTYMYGTSNLIEFNATGFIADPPGIQSTTVNTNNEKFIYIAIRRGPMKTPTDATEVFDVQTSSDDGGNGTLTSTSVTADVTITAVRSSGWDKWATTRLLGNTKLLTVSSSAASSSYSQWSLDEQYGFRHNSFTASNSTVDYTFRRAPGFMDVVTYTGTAPSVQTVPHGLGVAPELLLVRRLSGVGFLAYSADYGASGYGILAENYAFDTAYWGSGSGMWNNTDPTSSVFTIGPNNATNISGGDYVAYLFATCPGVSKVGSYTGTGSNINVDCGFTSGARFVLIKRTDTEINGQTPPTGYDTDWYVWDTARGIVAGNDPYLTLNTTDAEDTGTDFIDPYSAGFTVTSSAPAALNASGGSYIFLAIA